MREVQRNRRFLSYEISKSFMLGSAEIIFADHVPIQVSCSINLLSVSVLPYHIKGSTTLLHTSLRSTSVCGGMQDASALLQEADVCLGRPVRRHSRHLERL